VRFYLEQAGILVPEVGYVPLPETVIAAAKARFENRVKGSVFAAADAKGKTLEQLYASPS
jgi:hypothetical protein